jgi:hypothetical protein
LGEPLTEVKLNGLTVKDLKTAADGAWRKSTAPYCGKRCTP